MDGIRRLTTFVLFFFVPVLLTSGCTSFQKKMVADSSSLASLYITEAANSNSDFEIVRDGMPGGIMQMDGFIKMAPNNKDLLLTASESNSGYAFLFVHDTDKPRAAKLYLKARDYALRVLNQNSAFKDAFNKPREDFLEALKTFDKEDVPALYLAANGWLSYISLANAKDPSVLMDLPQVEAMMNRIVELDETYKYGAIHATLGAYYSSRPAIFGGKPEKSKYHFERAFKISDRKFLIWHVLYAQFYAVQVQDEDTFTETLEEAISAPDNLLPEQNFPNEAARDKAKALLEKADSLF